MTPRRIVFVCRQPTGEALRAAHALAALDNVELLGICEIETGAPALVSPTLPAEWLAVADVHDPAQLIAAARSFPPLTQIVTAHETLLEPVARANEALGLQAMSAATVKRTLDKRELQQTLAQAGIRVLRYATILSDADAQRFAARVGFPLVLKPLRGSGGLATWCIRDAEQLALALTLLRPSDAAPVLAEDYLEGQELCIDTVTIDHEPRVYSVCRYRTPILRALEDPSLRWSCVMPREQHGFADFIAQGLRAVRALQVGNAMTHMEGFAGADGSLGFTDATLRPAGARIGPMLAFAYDIDPHRAWARAVIDGRFDGPWERGYAVGTIFLRNRGDGRVEQVHGLDAVRQRLGECIVDARLPQTGATKSSTYTGDGYITVRHRETAAVEDALDFIDATVRIDYSDTAAVTGGPDAWRHRLQYSEKQLYKPPWEHDHVTPLPNQRRGEQQ